MNRWIGSFVMLGLADRGIRLQVARWGIEAALLATGIALGGQFGVATIIFLLATGPVLARDVVVALGPWSDLIFRPLGYAIPLGMKLVEEQSVDVQAFGTEGVGTQHPVERVTFLVHDRLAAVDHLEVFRQRRRGPHHRRRLAVDDARLLPVARGTVDFGTRLRVKRRHVERDAGEGGERAGDQPVGGFSSGAYFLTMAAYLGGTR